MESSSSESSVSQEDKWYGLVAFDPPDNLTLTANDRAKLRIANGSGRRVSYKIKTTRYNSVLPNRTYGLIEPFGNACVKVAYNPRQDERPFAKTDRLTVVLKAVADPNLKPEQLWKEKTHRRALHLVNNPTDVRLLKTPSSAPKQRHYFGTLGPKSKKGALLPPRSKKEVKAQ